MSRLFYNTTFNDDISNWSTSAVTDMSAMFYNATYFNLDISSWDVSAVTIMTAMFGMSPINGAPGAFHQPDFNQDISSWDVSAVTNMAAMFAQASAFNQDLSSWDVSAVTNMALMFSQAADFNQQLCWDVTGILTFKMFEDAGITQAESLDCSASPSTTPI
jgi:surface protein